MAIEDFSCRRDLGPHTLANRLYEELPIDDKNLLVMVEVIGAINGEDDDQSPIPLGPTPICSRCGGASDLTSV